MFPFSRVRKGYGDLLEVCRGRGAEGGEESTGTRSLFFLSQNFKTIDQVMLGIQREGRQRKRDLRGAKGGILERLLGEEGRAAHSSLLAYEMALKRGLVSGFQGKQPQVGMGIAEPKRQVTGGAPRCQHATCGDRL